MIVAVITARMGATRLPGKALADICGRPLLWHIVNRVRASRLINKIIIATDTKSKPIVGFAIQYDIPIYEGSDNDILDRLYQTAEKFGADVIVRVWGDCPLVNAQIIDELIKFYISGKYDYAYTKGYPEGQNVAIVSFGALEKAWRTLKNPKDREWIHLYFTKTKKYKVGVLESEDDLSCIKLSVDTAIDLERVRRLFERSKIIARR